MSTAINFLHSVIEDKFQISQGKSSNESKSIFSDTFVNKRKLSEDFCAS